MLGTWTSPTLLGNAPPAGVTATTTFTFNADQTFTMRGTANGASSGATAGCMGTIDVAGLRWASPDGTGAMNTIAITGTSSASDEVVGCTDTSLNHARAANSMYSNAVDMHGTYAITGNQLTITFTSGSGMAASLELTRQ